MKIRTLSPKPPHVRLRFKAQIWNASLKFPAHIWNTNTRTPFPPTVASPSLSTLSKLLNHRLKPQLKLKLNPHRKHKPKPCAFKPGRGVFTFYSVNRSTVAYRPPCLRETCGNCVYWYPRLVGMEVGLGLVLE